jgi:outer membrane protein OmpA-like peptidoglycan-associated protein
VPCFWKRFLPLGLLSLLAIFAFSAWHTSHSLEPALRDKAQSLLKQKPTLKDVAISNVDGQYLYLSGPAQNKLETITLLEGQYGVSKVIYTVKELTGKNEVSPASSTSPSSQAITIPSTARTALPTTPKPADTVAPTSIPPQTTLPVPSSAAPVSSCPKLPSLPGVTFSSSEATLAGNASSALTPVVTALKENSGCEILIVGHTDNQGDEDTNQQLSEERAEVIMKYLISQGIPASRLRAEGKGEKEPLSGTDQETDEGRSANRRIEFVPTNLGK